MNKGNALIEFSIGTAAFSLSLALFLFSVNASVVKWTLLETAQLGTDLQSMTDLPPAAVQSILISHLEKKKMPHRPEWFIDLSPPDSSAARFYNLVQTQVKARLPGGLMLEESVAAQKEPYE